MRRQPRAYSPDDARLGTRFQYDRRPIFFLEAPAREATAKPATACTPEENDRRQPGFGWSPYSARLRAVGWGVPPSHPLVKADHQRRKIIFGFLYKGWDGGTPGPIT